MVGEDPVVSINRPSNYGGRDAEGTEFIRFVDGREPQIHEFSDFGEDGDTSDAHPTAQVDVGARVVVEFATNYLT